MVGYALVIKQAAKTNYNLQQGLLDKSGAIKCIKLINLLVTTYSQHLFIMEFNNSKKP